MANILRQTLATQLVRASRKWPAIGWAAIGTDSGSYEGDGKTTLSILNKDNSGYLMIDGYSREGFRLSNEMFAFGPIAILPSTVFQWNVRDVNDIHQHSLSLFTILEPKIEVLVIGVGDKGVQIDPKIRMYLRELRIGCEVLSTHDAVTTYNFLNVDHRLCGGAFIPPDFVELPEFEIQQYYNRAAKNRFDSSYDITPKSES